MKNGRDYDGGRRKLGRTCMIRDYDTELDRWNGVHGLVIDWMPGLLNGFMLRDTKTKICRKRRSFISCSPVTVYL